jgi:hypothetical protein
MGCRSLLYTETETADIESNIYEIVSLMLYGSQAIPIRLKILLDRLLSSFTQDDILKIISSFGWSLQDYARGYILMVIIRIIITLTYTRKILFYNNRGLSMDSLFIIYYIACNLSCCTHHDI